MQGEFQIEGVQCAMVVQNRRGTVCYMHLTMIMYGQMGDGGHGCQKMNEADGQWCKQ